MQQVRPNSCGRLAPDHAESAALVLQAGPLGLQRQRDAARQASLQTYCACFCRRRNKAIFSCMQHGRAVTVCPVLYRVLLQAEGPRRRLLRQGDVTEHTILQAQQEYAGARLRLVLASSLARLGVSQVRALAHVQCSVGCRCCSPVGDGASRPTIASVGMCAALSLEPGNAGSPLR